MQLVEFLTEYKEIFTWSPKDLRVIPREFAEHKLRISKGRKLVFQKKWAFARQRQEIMRKEVQDLLDAGIIKPIDFPECQSNLVVVAKPGRAL